MADLPDIVVGSGPAGVSCASALLAQGRQVVMLDVGFGLEDERKGRIERMFDQPPDEWAPADLALVKGNTIPTTGGVPLKRLFGSAFPYRTVGSWPEAGAGGASVLPSMARGGLSNVWGACVLPAAESDIQDWPISYQELAPFYEKVAALFDLVGEADDLASRFPLFTRHPRPLNSSPQAEDILARLRGVHGRLAREGIIAGRSRLAFNPQPHAHPGGCAYCQLCMYGCPRRMIYSSEYTLADLTRNPRFTYVANVYVTGFQEQGGAVRIDAEHLPTRARVDYFARKLFLAAGVLPTAALVLASLDAYDRLVELRDSQYFLCPVVVPRSRSGVASAPQATLAQAFLEIFDPQVSERAVHLQLYTYNEMYSQLLDRIMGPLSWLKDPILDRLCILQGYLHSSLSPTVEMRLERTADRPRLSLRARPNARTRPAIKAALSKLARTSRYSGLRPVRPMLRVASPGRGFHCGATFPMSEHPQGWQSDTLGRLSGSENVHIVDASVLATIPATTITFTVMANAYRIGHRAA